MGVDGVVDLLDGRFERQRQDALGDQLGDARADACTPSSSS